MCLLSEIMGGTPSYISYLIKRELGQTFTEYLLDIRMIKLRELLQEDDYTISELAERLGYNNQAYFCRIVKRATGKTIKELKREMRGSHTSFICDGQEE